MSEEIFSAQDLGNVISIEDLTGYFITIIQQIRNGSKNVASTIYQDLEKLNTVSLEWQNPETAVPNLLNAYETLKKISMSLRKELSAFMDIDEYSEISYALYYDNKRYVTESIQASWLKVTSKGELRLLLDKATSDLEKQSANTLQNRIQELFQAHYESLLRTIRGTYKGIIGKGRLNEGHITEAFEEHLQEHHSVAYSIFQSKNVEQYSSIDKTLLEGKNEQWDESLDAAWAHVRHSLGTQRGTVAGDVGKWQVKRGSSKNEWTSQVRLSSLANLKKGVELYSQILTTQDIPGLAKQIAMYISEPVTKASANLTSQIADKKTQELLSIVEGAIAQGTRRV